MTPKLSFDHGCTGIPYGRFGDPNSHGYVPLKQQPELIESLPELQRDFLLKELVGYLNRPESAVETVGTEVWTGEVGLGYEAGKQKGCYIATIFTDPRLGEDSREWHWIFLRLSEALADKGQEHPEHCKPPMLHVELTLKAFAMHRESEEDRSGWQCEIWVQSGWGSEDGANKIWAYWVDLVVRTFDEVCRGYADLTESLGQVDLTNIEETKRPLTPP